MPKHILLVLTNPTEGREDRYNDWYTNTHIPDVLKVPGIVAAQRFKFAEWARPTVEGPHPEPPWRYVAVYEVDSDDPRAVQAEILSRVGTDRMRLTGAMDPEQLSFYCMPITERRTADSAA